MPKGTRPKNTVRVGYDPALARDTLRLNGRDVSEGRARVAVGDRAIAAAKSARATPRPARTPAPTAAAAAQPASRDLMRDGVQALKTNRERMRRIEEQAEGRAEGGYIRGKGKPCGHKRK